MNNDGISMEKMLEIIHEHLKMAKEGDYISVGDMYYRVHYGINIEFIPEKPGYKNSTMYK